MSAGAKLTLVTSLATAISGRVVVTGASGFIGSVLVGMLNRRGIEDVLACDRLDCSEKWKNLVPLRIRDYVDADDLIECVERDPSALGDVRFLFHLGAISSTTECDAQALLRNNYEYTKRLVAWALPRGIRVVYASSAATYGALEQRLPRLALNQENASSNLARVTLITAPSSMGKIAVFQAAEQGSTPCGVTKAAVRQDRKA